MYELKKKLERKFTSKFVGTGPLSYEKGIYLAAVSQRLRNTGLRYFSHNIVSYPTTQEPLATTLYEPQHFIYFKIPSKLKLL